MPPALDALDEDAMGKRPLGMFFTDLWLGSARRRHATVSWPCLFNMWIRPKHLLRPLTQAYG